MQTTEEVLSDIATAIQSSRTTLLRIRESIERCQALPMVTLHYPFHSRGETDKALEH